jgi:hypothetical protein
MTTRKQVAELSAMLALRAPKVSPSATAEAALKLCRFAAAAETNAVNLCNVPNYQARHDRKRDSIVKHAAPVAAIYGLSVQCGGDPRGYCLKLFAMPGKPPVRGNTWGGDEDGYGV